MKRSLIYLLLLLTLFCSCLADINKQQIVVGILPYNNFPTVQLDSVKANIERYYGAKVYILPSRILPKSAFVNIKTPRYRADSLIAIQKRNLPYSIDYIVGLTNKDISVPKYENGKIKKPEWKYNDFGVMGLGYRPGNSCVVSTFRLKTTNKLLFYKRLEKVVLHELGHNMGLPHCDNPKCVMTSAAEKISTIDNANASLCSNCARKIKE